jgi:hypothetical protein
MTDITIASVNGEWMNNWFSADAEQAAFRSEFVLDGQVGDTDEAAGRLAGLIDSLNADVVALMEAPSREAELELFLTEYLTGSGYECLIGDSGGAQKLALLYRPDVIRFGAEPRAALSERWDADVDGDLILAKYAFTRAPLATRAVVNGTSVEVIVTHLKSNFVNKGKQLWENPDTQIQFVREALKNRRRIATEGMRIRRYLDERLLADRDAAIVVLGDLNDGPGRDYFEELYLAHNVTDILAGSPYEPELVFFDAPADVPLDKRFTAVFDDYVTDEKDKKLLLDHILLSPAFSRPGPVSRVPGSGKIAHTEWAAQVEGDGGQRDKRATDHRPVTVRVTT